MIIYGLNGDSRLEEMGDFECIHDAMDSDDGSYSDYFSTDDLKNLQLDIDNIVGSADIVLPMRIADAATRFIEQLSERDEAYERQDHDSAFDIECDQRDNGAEMASWILKG